MIETSASPSREYLSMQYRRFRAMQDENDEANKTTWQAALYTEMPGQSQAWTINNLDSACLYLPTRQGKLRPDHFHHLAGEMMKMIRETKQRSRPLPDLHCPVRKAHRKLLFSSLLLY